MIASVEALMKFLDENTDFRDGVASYRVSSRPFIVKSASLRVFDRLLKTAFQDSAEWESLDFRVMEKLLILVDAHCFFSHSRSLTRLSDSLLLHTIFIVGPLSTSLFVTSHILNYSFINLLRRRIGDLERISQRSNLPVGHVASCTPMVRAAFSRSLIKYSIGLKDRASPMAEGVEKRGVEARVEAVADVSHLIVVDERKRERACSYLSKLPDFVSKMEDVADSIHARKELSSKEAMISIENEMTVHGGFRNVDLLYATILSFSKSYPYPSFLFFADTLLDLVVYFTTTCKASPPSWGFASLLILFMRLSKGKENLVCGTHVHNALVHMAEWGKKCEGEDMRLYRCAVSHCTSFLLLNHCDDGLVWCSKHVGKRWHFTHSQILSSVADPRGIQGDEEKRDYARIFRYMTRDGVTKEIFSKLCNTTIRTMIACKGLVDFASSFITSVLLDILSETPNPTVVFDFLKAFESTMPGGYEKRLTMTTLSKINKLFHLKGKGLYATHSGLFNTVKLFLCHTTNYLLSHSSIPYDSPFDRIEVMINSKEDSLPKEETNHEDKAVALCKEEDALKEREEEKRRHSKEKNKAKKKRREANKAVRRAEAEKEREERVEREEKERMEKVKEESDRKILTSIEYARKDIRAGVDVEEACLRVRNAMQKYHNTCSEETRRANEEFRQETKASSCGKDDAARDSARDSPRDLTRFEVYDEAVEEGASSPHCITTEWGEEGEWFEPSSWGDMEGEEHVIQSILRLVS